MNSSSARLLPSHGACGPLPLLLLPKSIAILPLDERERFQLLAITLCLREDNGTGRLRVSDLLALVSNGTYTKEEIERTENELLHVLGWRINPPTAMQFAFHIMSVITPHVANIHDDLVAKVMDETAYQAENSVRDYSLSQDGSSSIAVAALINAAYQLLDSGIRREFLLALCCTLVGILPIRRSCRWRGCVYRVSSTLAKPPTTIRRTSPRETRALMLQSSLLWRSMQSTGHLMAADALHQLAREREANLLWCKFP